MTEYQCSDVCDMEDDNATLNVVGVSGDSGVSCGKKMEIQESLYLMDMIYCN